MGFDFDREGGAVCTGTLKTSTQSAAPGEEIDD